VSLVWAQKNIALNQWQHKIELRKPPPNSILLHIVYPNEQFDFCMCNPPFFASSEEKFVNPHTVCTATESEMSTAGGELAFVSQIIQESLTLRERVRWYTSMIGRKVNVKALLTELHKHQITNIRQVEFVQGKTTRWAIGWSFSQEGLDLIQKEALKERYRDKNKLNMCVKSTDPRVLLTRIEQTLTTAFGFVCTINDINYTIRVRHACGPMVVSELCFHTPFHLLRRLLRCVCVYRVLFIAGDSLRFGSALAATPASHLSLVDKIHE
jgi:hypothetical protein